MRTQAKKVARAAFLAAALIAGGTAAEAAGALAVGSCGAFGYSFDYGTMAGARARALAECVGACQIVAQVRRGCAAYAIDDRNWCGAYGYAVAGSRRRAQALALSYCRSYGGRACFVRAWVCDGRG